MFACFTYLLKEGEWRRGGNGGAGGGGYGDGGAGGGGGTGTLSSTPMPAAAASCLPPGPLDVLGEEVEEEERKEQPEKHQIYYTHMD